MACRGRKAKVVRAIEHNHPDDQLLVDVIARLMLSHHQSLAPDLEHHSSAHTQGVETGVKPLLLARSHR